ncbi:MAG: hypothetical protein M3Y65_20565 [Pseudomonadota bacterium]|nr:hypothetical protein [Pseudomonadota bacterium]
MTPTIPERIRARADLNQMRIDRDITGLAAALNVDSPSVLQLRYVTARTVMSSCADGVDILSALQAAAENAAVRWALQFLGQNSGLDIGDPFTQGMVDQLVAGSVLSADQGAQLKAMAIAPLLVTQEQVAEEMYHPDGTEK